jgi:hypothetical protein
MTARFGWSRFSLELEARHWLQCKPFGPRLRKVRASEAGLMNDGFGIARAMSATGRIQASRVVQDGSTVPETFVGRDFQPFAGRISINYRFSISIDELLTRLFAKLFRLRCRRIDALAFLDVKLP